MLIGDSLHYHALLILLHWSSASYDLDLDDDYQSAVSLSTVSRQTCWDNALRISRIIEIYTQNSPVQNASLPVIMHTVIAAIVLICSLVREERANEMRSLSSLLSLSQTLKAIAATSRPTNEVSQWLAAAVSGLQLGMRPQFERAYSQSLYTIMLHAASALRMPT